jgi:hypothetical protein
MQIAKITKGNDRFLETKMIGAATPESRRSGRIWRAETAGDCCRRLANADLRGLEDCHLLGGARQAATHFSSPSRRELARWFNGSQRLIRKGNGPDRSRPRDAA